MAVIGAVIGAVAVYNALFLINSIAIQSITELIIHLAIRSNRNIYIKTNAKINLFVVAFGFFLWWLVMVSAVGFGRLSVGCCLSVQLISLTRLTSCLA